MTPPLPDAPRPAFACPLCGRANHCAVAAAGRFDVPCWCSGVAIDPAVLSRIGADPRDRACLCPACARGAGPQGAPPSHAA